MRKKVGLVFGGKSGEHDVSINTTMSILKEIDYEKYVALPIYVDTYGSWQVSEVEISRKPSADLTFEDIKASLLEESPNLFLLAKEVDVFFPLIHGTFGEDGTLQGLFEMLNVPYVGSGVMGSAVGMDKVMMKKIFESSGIPQCSYLSYNKGEILNQTVSICEKIESTLAYPCFVKPANAGSSLGITKAANRVQLMDGLEEALKYDTKVLIEEMVVGRELEIGILGNEQIETSAVGEVVTSNNFYDFEAKYKNQNATSIQIPARIPDSVVERMSVWAKKVCKELNCYGLSRVDFFWIEETDQLFVNEINTIPGFTPFSMYPLLFKEVGLTYPKLIERLLSLAVNKHEEKYSNFVQEKI